MGKEELTKCQSEAVGHFIGTSSNFFLPGLKTICKVGMANLSLV